MKVSLFLLGILLLPTTMLAQESEPTNEDCKVESLDFLTSPDAPDTTAASSDAAWTEAEKTVAALIKEKGIHVVRLWAPWCHNSMSELEDGWWRTVIGDNPDVSFTFVTVLNEGDLNADILAKHGIPERVKLLALPETTGERRRMFMDFPIHWTPSTWVFHREGERAFALNYGELNAQILQQMLDLIKKDWSHD